MADHRTTVLVTACLKAPVDPQTKAPLASYERDAVLRVDNRDYEEVSSSGRFRSGTIALLRTFALVLEKLFAGADDVTCGSNWTGRFRSVGVE